MLPRLGNSSAVNVRRLALYLALLALVAVAGFAAVLWALSACAPPPLPGDELWTWRQHAGQALDLIGHVGTTACYTADAAAETLLWLGVRTAGVLLVLLALMVLWETLGRELRLLWFRTRGGHVLLAGTADDLAGLARRHDRFAGTVYLAPDRAALAELARARPFAEIRLLHARTLARQMAQLGAARAKLVAAVTGNDLSNVAIAEAALDRPGSGEVLLRLEQGAVRALSSDPLRRRAERLGRPLSVVSLSHLQTRRGMAAAMSGRYTLDGPPRVHIALCGTGEGLQAAALDIVRQGFGLESGRPLITILRTGSADFTAGTLERLLATQAAEVEVATALASAAGGLDRAIGGIVLDHPPLHALHCVGATPEEAEAIALACEEALVRLGQPVPPIVVYGASDRPLGTTGMIRIAAEPDLADAHALAQLMDRRARAVHALFVAAQREARGDAFGTAPAEAEWEHLPEAVRDDNRNVADQMDFKLATIFAMSKPGQGTAALSAAETATLARLAHERWWAAKALAGWQYGPLRDDRRLLHPDMIPYDQLAEPIKQKDRDEVASLIPMAALAGETLVRERRIAAPAPLAAAAVATLLQNFAPTPQTQIPVVVLSLDRPEMITLAETLLHSGIALELVLDDTAAHLRRNETTAPRLAAILGAAWRIHVALDRTASAAALGRAGETVNERGGIDALV